MRAKTRSILLAALVLSAATVGCGSKQLAVQPPGQAAELGPDEGLLVVHVDTEVPLSHLTLSRYELGQNLPAGRHLWLVRIPAGRYRWTEVGLAGQTLDRIDLQEYGRRLARIDDFVWDDEFAIEVEAGVVNYPGELLIGSDWRFRSSGSGYWVRNRNHAAAALRRMTERYGGIVESRQIRYAGSGRDEFLDHYTRTRDAIARSGRDVSPMRRRIGTVVACVALGVWLVLEAGSVCAAGQSFELLLPAQAVQRVSLSPSGEWIAAQMRLGDLHGIQVQRLGSRRLETILTIEGWIAWMDWVDGETLVARADGRFIAFRLGVGPDDRPERFVIGTEGFFVDGLPLVDDEFVWALEHGGRTSLYRVDLDELRSLDRERDARGRQQRPRKALVTVAGSVRHWLVDREGVPRVAMRYDAEDHEWEVLARIGLLQGFQSVYSYAAADEEHRVLPVALRPGGDSVVVVAYGGENTLGLHEFDLKSGQVGRAIFRRPDVDVTNVLRDAATDELIAAVAEPEGAAEYFYLDSYREKFADRLDPAFSLDSVRVLGETPDRRGFLFFVAGSADPGTFYYRDVPKAKTIRIAEVGSKIDRASLAETESFFVESKDGTRIEAFLTAPPSAVQSMPLVVMPHGGPYSVRDSRTYNPLVQYLVSWGFAVLQVNFRGSSGYGLSFAKAGEQQMALGIEDDIDAAFEAAVERASIDGSRACVVGWSYGGFSALASVVRHRDRYRCSVSINGVADVPFIFETSDAGDWTWGRRAWKRIWGDIDDDRNRMIEVSPLYKVDRIETPVFLIFGDEDRRVDPDHSHRMIAMLDLLEKDYEYLEVEGMAHSPTRLQYIVVARALRRFLTGHLTAAEFAPDPPVDLRHRELVPLDLGL